VRDPLKSLFNKQKAEQAYRRAKPYAVTGARFTLNVLLTAAAYVLDALNNLRLRARQEPFIALAALATIIYAVFAYNQWQVMHGQLRIMADQLNQMDISQRPWVRLTVANPRYLLVQETGVDIDLEFRAKNIGHSPAEGVYISGKVFPELSLTEQNTAARAVCDSAREIFENNPYGKNLEYMQSIIFPNEERQIREVGALIISTDEMIQSKVREIDFQYSGSLPYIGEKQAATKREEALANLKTKPIFSAFYIVGCIVYTYRSGSAFGKTAFVLNVFRPCTESPVGACTFEVGSRRDYEANEMQVKEYNLDLLAE
jgi:hypothetical protein